MYEREKLRSAKKVRKVRGVQKKSMKNQGVRERKSANAKKAKFKAKKECESESAKSFPQESKSASAKPKKSECPALETYSVKTSKLPPTMETSRLKSSPWRLEG
jgi:hypothetical protein